MWTAVRSIIRAIGVHNNPFQAVFNGKERSKTMES